MYEYYCGSNNILTLRNPHYILMNRDCLPSQIRLITHYPTVYIFTNPIHDRIHFPPHRHTQSNRNEIPRNTDNISLAAQSHQFAPKQNYRWSVCRCKGVGGRLRLKCKKGGVLKLATPQILQAKKGSSREKHMIPKLFSSHSQQLPTTLAVFRS